MAILNKKLKIKEAGGSTVDCNIYTTQTEAGDTALNLKVSNQNAFVSLKDVDAYGATKGRAKINGATYVILSKAGLPYTEKSWTEPGTYTFTVPAGVTRIRVAVCGGGGSGAGTGISAGHGFAGGTSSFGDLLSATGGGGATGTSGGGGRPGAAGTPNGYAGEWSKGGYTKGFALSFEKTDGDYGRGSGFNRGDNPMQGGSGGYDSQYITVMPNTTYEVNVGEGGAKPTNFAAFYDEGVSGFVLIAYGGDI